MGLFNLEQEEAALFDSKKGLKDYLGKIPAETAQLYKQIDKKIQTAFGNKINCLFFLIQKDKNVELFSSGLTDENRMHEINKKIEARKNFKLFINQILMVMNNFGFDCVIRDRLNKRTLSNFNPEGDDDSSDDFWKEKSPN